MSFFDRDPYAHAEKNNLDVVAPKANEVFIDIDDDADDEWLKKMLEMLENNGVSLLFVKATTSKSGNKHVYLTTADGRELSDVERIAIQACLGSDRQRELLSLLRIWNNSPQPPTLFFEVREELPA